jgi:hypothetical protein
MTADNNPQETCKPSFKRHPLSLAVGRPPARRFPSFFLHLHCTIIKPTLLTSLHQLRPLHRQLLHATFLQTIHRKSKTQVGRSR